MIMRAADLTLISHPLCPFVQRAAIVLLEKGVPFERINVDLSAKPEWFLAISPTGKVLVLKVRQPDRPEAILFESRVICEYLEETQAGPRMYPDDALLRARQRGWIEFADQTMTEGWQFLHARDADTAEARCAGFRDRLRRLEAELSSGPYFAGAQFGIVDAIYAPLFRYFAIIDPEIGRKVFKDLPQITAWKASLAERFSVREAVAENYDDCFIDHLRQHESLLAH